MLFVLQCVENGIIDIGVFNKLYFVIITNVDIVVCTNCSPLIDIFLNSHEEKYIHSLVAKQKKCFAYHIKFTYMAYMTCFQRTIVTLKITISSFS